MNFEIDPVIRKKQPRNSGRSRSYFGKGVCVFVFLGPNTKCLAMKSSSMFSCVCMVFLCICVGDMFLHFCYSLQKCRVL